jgi:hypothetical protein
MAGSDWLIGISAFVTATATVVLVVVTARYARYTGQMLDQLREQRRELEKQRKQAQEQRMDAFLPVILVTTKCTSSDPHMSRWVAELINFGVGPAVNMQIQLSPPEEYHIHVIGFGDGSKCTKSIRLWEGQNYPIEMVENEATIEISCFDVFGRQFGGAGRVRDQGKFPLTITSDN